MRHQSVKYIQTWGYNQKLTNFDFEVLAEVSLKLIFQCQKYFKTSGMWEGNTAA